MAGLLSDIRDNNYLQPNRQFTIRGEVKYIKKETEYTEIVLSVFDYYNQEQPDEIRVYFKGNPKKIADKAIQYKQTISVIGDIIIKSRNGNVIFNGKIIEVFKVCQFNTDINARTIEVKGTNYNRGF